MRKEVVFKNINLEYTIFAKLDGFRINPPYDSKLTILSGFNVFNNLDNIKEAIGAESISFIGSLDYNELLSSKFFICKKFTNEAEEFNTLESLDEFFENLELFSKILWFMKDCSTSIDKCYMSYNLAGQLFVDVLEPNLVYFDSLGNKENTEFDINEIEFAESIYQNFISGISLPENEPPKSISQKGALNRVARAFNFVRQSRMNNDLGLKIANFCTAFEALFSTSSSELTYKLATRLAYFIGSDPENRKQIFKLMRDAYSIRSSVVHGDEISKSKFNLIQEIVIKCDEMLRLIISNAYLQKELFDLFNSKNEAIEEYFNDLVLGLIEPPIGEE
jgi:hypothetical protein